MKEKLPFLIYMAVGAVLMAVSLAIRSDYYSNLVFWMGFGTLVAEGVHLARQMWWQAPSRQAAYQAKRRQDHIDAVDERKQMLRMRAGWLCNAVMSFVLLFLGLLLALLQAQAWVIAMVFALLVFQYILGILIYHNFEKKL